MEKKKFVALLIMRPDGKVCFVPKRGEDTIPTEHFEASKGDRTLAMTAFRCAEEEFSIKASDICIKRSLGWVPSMLQSGERIRFKVFFCSVSNKTAGKIRFSEKGEVGQEWFDPVKKSRLLTLDYLAGQAIVLFLRKTVFKKMPVSAGIAKRRGSQWQKKEISYQMAQRQC